MCGGMGGLSGSGLVQPALSPHAGSRRSSARGPGGDAVWRLGRPRRTAWRPPQPGVMPARRPVTETCAHEKAKTTGCVACVFRSRRATGAIRGSAT
jgi:hypothetical protein